MTPPTRGACTAAREVPGDGGRVAHGPRSAGKAAAAPAARRPRARPHGTGATLASKKAGTDPGRGHGARARSPAHGSCRNAMRARNRDTSLAMHACRGAARLRLVSCAPIPPGRSRFYLPRRPAQRRPGRE